MHDGHQRRCDSLCDSLQSAQRALEGLGSLRDALVRDDHPKAGWPLLDYGSLTAGGTRLRPTAYVVHSSDDGGHIIVAPSTAGVLLNRGFWGSLGGGQRRDAPAISRRRGEPSGFSPFPVDHGG